MKTTEYMVTFGQRYRILAHEKSLIPIHPDGYVRITANSMEEAREIAFDEFGEFFSHVYELTQDRTKYFPNGEITSLPRTTESFPEFPPSKPSHIQ